MQNQKNGVYFTDDKDLFISVDDAGKSKDWSWDEYCSMATKVVAYKNNEFMWEKPKYHYSRMTLQHLHQELGNICRL